VSVLWFRWLRHSKRAVQAKAKAKARARAEASGRARTKATTKARARAGGSAEVSAAALAVRAAAFAGAAIAGVFVAAAVAALAAALVITFTDPTIGRLELLDESWTLHDVTVAPREEAVQNVLAAGDAAPGRSAQTPLAGGSAPGNRVTTGDAVEVWLPVEPQISVVWMPGHESGPYVSARAAILFENTTGTVLYSKNPHERRPPASTTKILTAILALERSSLDELVTVSRRAAATPGSTARLYTGQKIRMRDLLHGLLLRSGNDAAVAIAEHVAGSEAAFVAWMNRRAAELGALNSRFENPHGLDSPGHYSTAYDLALISRIALVYPTFAEIVRTRTYQFEGQTWTNTNKLLWTFEGLEGIKTGTTSGAGYCLVAAASQDGMQLISVVLGSNDRWSDSSRLLSWGFEEFHRVTLAEQGDVLARIPLADGMAPVVAVAGGPLGVIVRDEDISRVTARIEIDPKLKAPIRRGDPVGKVEIYVDDDLVKSVSLVAAASIARRTPWRVIWEWIHRAIR